MKPPSPDLSIIVPVFNDAVELAGLLENLADQRGVTFELILCDGGSHDDTLTVARRGAAAISFPLRLIRAPRGRGVQMNAGAAAAAGDLLLFLHADTRFTSPDAIRTGLATFRASRAGVAGPCAARFGLVFRRSASTPSLPYFYHEAKARLNRGDCIRGDQGYLIERTQFEELGGFDGSLPYLEDLRLAERLAGQGRWLLLPATITTSARRFEQEGFYQRQIVNVIIVNAVAIGWNELLEAVPELYRCSATSGRLKLFPLLAGIRTLINSHDDRWRREFWRATGHHVAANAWQLFFWLDVRDAFGKGGCAGDVRPAWLSFYQRRLERCFHGALAARLAALLTRAWFRWILFRETSRKD